MQISANNLSVSPAAASEWCEVTPGERFVIRASVAQTGGLYMMLEVVADPRNGVPMHVHAEEEEHFFILEGRVHLTSGDRTVELSAGEALTVKRGTPHAWCNLSDRIVRMLIILSPGNLERTFRLIGSLKGADLQAALESNESDGSTIVGPPPFDDIYSILSPRPRP